MIRISYLAFFIVQIFPLSASYPIDNRITQDNLLECVEPKLHATHSLSLPSLRKKLKYEYFVSSYPRIDIQGHSSLKTSGDYPSILYHLGIYYANYLSDNFTVLNDQEKRRYLHKSLRLHTLASTTEFCKASRCKLHDFANKIRKPSFKRPHGSRERKLGL